ncbi:MAG: UDP-N-acetylglucosamine--N-acetylmuramyl-(pentapeptide) pyrophosphoryl-undecaprenol N-acetylglucosamine transferase [Fuerstiella sp.]|nr:UDP-N-acetylglucosamine--N-acetylmuramyl-(pentapeptide) pyrophosphoryl-undecaprenol N-acetylglucosamine transferase [Fuerstiella sp.]
MASAVFQQDPDAQATFLTSHRDIDRVVLENSFVADDKRCSIISLSVTQPPGLKWSNISQTRALAGSVLRCRRRFKSISTHVVFATGGFASLPGLLAAKRSRIPTVLFEANTQPGKITRWWKPLATARFCAWPAEKVPLLTDFKCVGMPVRSWNTDTTNETHSSMTLESRRILIVGGSQGSQRLNEIVHAALPRLKLPYGWEILHQTGSNIRPVIVTQSGQPRITTKPYLDDLPGTLESSAFVISRAGAVTLGEIAATGCPSILVPLSTAALNHQQSNAEFLRQQGAALVIDETGSHPQVDLANAVHALVNNHSSRQMMSQAARLLHRPNAADEIARSLIELSDLTQRNH